MGNTERDLLGEGLFFNPGFAGRRDHELLVGVQVLSEEWINLIYVINISGAVNINTIGTTTTTIGNILSTTNISGSSINISGDLNINTGGTATTIIGSSGNTTIIVGNTNIGTQGVSNLYLRGEYVVLNDTGGSVNIGGVSSGTINLYRPLTPNYPISFTSGQIGYSSSSTVSGSFVRGTYNTVIAPTLTGVYMSVALSSIYGTTYYGINNYDLQVGLNGVGVKVRNSLDGANLTLQVYTQTVPYVYSSGGTENPASAGLYTSLYVYFSSTTSTAYYSTTLYYTRVA